MKQELNIETVDMDIIRGDTTCFGLEITSPVAPSALVMTVKEAISDKTPVWQLDLMEEISSTEVNEDGDTVYTYIVCIPPEKTYKLRLTEYCYDVELRVNEFGENVFTLMIGKIRVHYDVTR